MSNNTLPDCSFEIIQVPKISYFRALSTSESIHYIFRVKAYLTELYNKGLISKNDKENESRRIQEVVINYIKALLAEKDTPASPQASKSPPIIPRKTQSRTRVCQICQQPFEGHRLALYCPAKTCQKKRQQINHQNWKARKRNK